MFLCLDVSDNYLSLRFIAQAIIYVKKIFELETSILCLHSRNKQEKITYVHLLNVRIYTNSPHYTLI